MSNLKIFVAGHRGMVGSALTRILLKQNVEIVTKNRSQLNLLSQKEVQKFFEFNKIDQVYLAAAKVGGIYANDHFPAEFIYENLMIQTNIIHNAFKYGVKKLLFLGSSCIYPKNCEQPINEEKLLSGKLEPTNEPYAIAKIAGIKMCESYNRQYGTSHDLDYRSVMPTNLYGPGDSYHPENSHVIPGLMYRFHQAKINSYDEVIIWGTGTPRREFLYVDDLASAAIHIMNIDKEIYDQNTTSMNSHINAGSGKDVTIKELAEIIREVVGYDGKIKFDNSKPDGNPRKLLNSRRLNNINWHPEISLKEGLIKTYSAFKKVSL
tara:strand:+ start:333 stop:1295 length:963 start_codon:yes stop_codon:yes gene_type:complete